MRKSADEMNNEARSRSSSVVKLSSEAQLVMQKKLVSKNKLKGAVKNIKAANVFARVNEKISPEKGSPKQLGGGYNELLDEGSGERMVSLADEENQLLKDDVIDDTLF